MAKPTKEQIEEAKAEVMAEDTEEQIEEEVVEEAVTVTAGKRKLIISLGESLPVGATLSNDVLKDLLGAGYTEKRLFGK